MAKEQIKKQEDPKPVAPIQNVQQEASAWDMRLAHAKNEVASLLRQKEALIADAKNVQASIEQQASQRLAETRKESQKVSNAREKLEDDKKEFESILIAFRKEKAEFQEEKAKILAMKSNCEKAESKIGEFVRLVKAGAERL